VKLDPDQLEWIVREVVRRLGDQTLCPPPPGGEGRGEGGVPPKDAHIVISQTLITASTLEHKLAGVTQVTIPAKAVITPSARDLLKQHNVELHRS
jgi:hypothetical protein